MRAVDGKRLAKPAGASAKQANIVETAPLPHQVYAFKRLQRADQHRTARFADRVQAPVNPVGPIDIGASGRPEHRGVALGRSAKGVRGRVVGAIGFGLHDDAADAIGVHAGADQIARHNHGVACEK